MNFTVAEIRALLETVRAAPEPTLAPAMRDALLRKLRPLSAAGPRRTFDSSCAACRCGHALAEHDPADAAHPCTHGTIEVGPYCECDRFEPTGQRTKSDRA